MKKSLPCIIILLLLHCSPGVWAQWKNGLWTEKQAYNWYFGDHAGLSFHTAPPSGITDSAIAPGLENPGVNQSKIIEGSGSISDAEGNLLLYTNGQTVWNADNMVMENGEGLFGHPSSVQNGLIVPAPGNPALYYIFTLHHTLGFCYSKVDMTLDGGLGAVTEKNIQLAANAEERISAVYHADGENVWVVTNGFNNNEIRSYLVSQDGVSETPVITSMGVIVEWSWIGSMKFSPDGSKIALVRGPWTMTYTVEVFNFDKVSGAVTGLVATLGSSEFTGDVDGPIGAEFSPDSRFLYVSSYGLGTVHQFDTMAGSEDDIRDSGVLIGQISPTSNYTMQLGPDGKIYLAHGNQVAENPYVGSQSTLNVIHFPNNEGLASGFEAYAVDLLNGRNDFSTPVFIQSYFASGILYEGGECPGEELSFSTLRIAGIEDIVWDFGDPSSGSANTSTAMEPVHIFANPGTYTVTATITSNGAEQTTTTQVHILVPGAAIPASDALSKCADVSGNATFDLTGLDAAILDGQDASNYTVAYYVSPEEATSGNAIAPADEFMTSGQAIYAVVTNATTGCSTMIDFVLVVHPLPSVGNPSDIQECDTSSGAAVFDLTAQSPAILDGQAVTDFNVVYYTDAGLTAEISQPAAFQSAGQTIYATVSNTSTSCTALTQVQFDLVVLAQPVLPEVSTYQGCSPFDLVSIAGTPGPGTIYSFHTSEQEALDNTGAIGTPTGYIVPSNAGSIYIRSTGATGCMQVGELLLEPGNCVIPRGISPNGDGDNDSFDLSGFDVNMLNIYNRYGTKVYSRSDYTNQWSGQSDNGQELPDGTYFYVVEVPGGNKTGWVYINR